MRESRISYIPCDLYHIIPVWTPASRWRADSSATYIVRKWYELTKIGTLANSTDDPNPNPGDAELRKFVSDRLAERWSPEQICHAVRRQFPGQPWRHIVPETIYQGVYRRDLGGLRGICDGCCGPADVAASRVVVPTRAVPGRWSA
jgi:hypothetical protein